MAVQTLKQIIEAAIFAALERNNWNKQAAADELQVSLKTIYNWIKRMETTAE